MADVEASLIVSIGDYERQLVQLRSAAQCVSSGVQDRDDLLKLGDDMEQLISLSKDALLSIKKKRLLDEVDRLAGVQVTAKCESSFTETKQPDVDASTTEASNEGDGVGLEALLTSLEGTRCRAPFGFHWGQQDYHNAVVLHVEPHDSIESMEDVTVRVMFCNPTVDAMKPCPYFLDGSCRFSDDQCRFSHGQVVSFGLLRKFVEPDYGLLQRDAPCLAKYKDDLWYPAVVELVSDDDHKVTVKYKSYGSETTLELEDVIPLDMYLSSSDTEGETSDSNDDDFRFPVGTCVFDSISTSQAFGQWEKHTRGIGSKLMAKMGYVLGTGLGKNGEGRTEPVEAVVVPQGKSLDQIMEIREKKGRGERRDCEKKRKRKIKRRAKVVVVGYEGAAERVSVFDFINERLVTEPGKSSDSNQLSKDCWQKQKLKEATGKNLNTKSLKVSEDIRRAHQELKRLQSAFVRNQTSDKLVATQYRQKIIRQEQEIRDLKDYEKAIQVLKKSKMKRNNVCFLCVFIANPNWISKLEHSLNSC